MIGHDRHGAGGRATQAKLHRVMWYNDRMLVVFRECRPSAELRPANTRTLLESYLSKGSEMNRYVTIRDFIFVLKLAFVIHTISCILF